MRKLVLTLAAAGAVLAAGALTAPRADAASFGGMALGSAAQDVSIVVDAHCRPGFYHHRFRPHDGCFMRRRPRVLIVR